MEQIGKSCWVMSLLLLRDFNAVLSHVDRVNSDPVTPQETKEFQKCIDDIKVGPVLSRGRHMTWCNKREGDSRIYSHIDWVFGNSDYFQQYSYIEAKFLEPGCSDHLPVVLTTKCHQLNLRKPFRLLNVVIQQRNFSDLVEEPWRTQVQGHAMFKVWRKLQSLDHRSKHLNKEYSSVELRLNK